jgi:nitric oxide reductase large subunit
MTPTDENREEYRLMSLDVARWRLAVAWFCIGGAVFVVLVGQSMLGVYENRVQSAWGWALPNFIPTLALMISVFAADALKPYQMARTPKVREPFFKLSMGLSIFYLVILLSTILLQPIVLTFRGDPKFTQIDMLQMSNLWLAPLQGLVVASLGVLFFLTQENPAHGQSVGSVKEVTKVSAPSSEVETDSDPAAGA